MVYLKWAYLLIFSVDIALVYIDNCINQSHWFTFFILFCLSFLIIFVQYIFPFNFYAWESQANISLGLI